MANYSDDNDLIDYHDKIMEYGVTDWESQHDDAKETIDREIDIGWYRRWNTDWANSPFDPDLLLNVGTGLKRVSCFKALELAFGKITKGDDRFINLEKIFRGRYERELGIVLKAGFDYDTDESGAIDDGERSLTPGFSLLRA